MPELQPTPAKIDVSLSRGVTIQWQDGHTSHYEIKYLRDECPCATCTDAHGTGEKPTSTKAQPTAGISLPMYKPAGHKLPGAEPVGHYALQLHFDDRHDSGIFTWTYLREICPCDTCRNRNASLQTSS